MTWLETIKLLLQFGLRPIRGKTHQERLESFYGYQADRYDAFREGYLRGRRELLDQIPFKPGCRWLDVGCGTGWLIEAAGDRARQCERIVLVDLTTSLLNIARQRVKTIGLSNVEFVETDATNLTRPDFFDVVTFSYSLTMMPEWFVAIDRAYDLMCSGGTIGVVDFYVGRKYDSIRQTWMTRHFWPAWFDTDNVWPDKDHLAYLKYRYHPQVHNVSRTKVPGMPWLRPPYFVFLGAKKDHPKQAS